MVHIFKNISSRFVACDKNLKIFISSAIRQIPYDGSWASDV